MFYGAQAFDAKLVVAQIAAVQTTFYTVIAMALTALAWFLQLPINLNNILGGHAMCVGDEYAMGWAPVVAALAAAPVVSYTILRCVGR
jgi:hypothetical protein